MEKYNYIEAVKADIKAYLEDNIVELTEDNIENLIDDMWVCDQVTGNASGSYTFNTWQAEENLCHNWELIEDVCEEFGCEPDITKGAEYWDVSIRCYLLAPCLREMLERGESCAD